MAKILNPAVNKYYESKGTLRYAGVPEGIKIDDALAFNHCKVGGANSNTLIYLSRNWQKLVVHHQFRRP